MEGFSIRLKTLRKNRGLRQKDLAGVLGLAQTTIANYEQNTRFPDEPTLRRIADYFNTSLDYLLGRSETVRPATERPRGAAAAPLSDLSRGYLDALIAGDRESAAKLIMEERERGASPQSIYSRVLAPALEEVGRLWEVSQVDVYQEHLVSEFTVELMSRVMRGAPLPRRRNGTVLAVACSGEQHEIGLRMVSDFLELDGWRTVYLGTNLPYRSLIKAVEDCRADIVGVSVTLQQHLNGAENLIASLRASESCRGVRVLVGGRCFLRNPDAWREIGADAVAQSAEEAVRVADRLAKR